MSPNFFNQVADVRQEVKKGNLNAVLTRFSDLVLVVCLAMIVGLMIVPLPTFLLDVFLTVNITAAITILIVSIYVSNGAQIASFPTILLLTTLYRLSLEISSTRLILLRGDAGDVIKAFGEFVVGGNFVVGAVIFLIITLVQFIVITKGSERVAEVSARFTLDAMPGKQMSIDADMRGGSIDFKTARNRRQMLARESQFYGAMDGAMKFVKGDAIAGIIITVINIVGGLVIGVMMNGLSASEAIETYSILTIGDGLVSQIPALLISISAGVVVTRVASDDEESNIGSDIAGQIIAKPKAIAIASAILFAVGMIPGMPKLAFLLMTVVTGGLAYGLFKAKGLAAKAKETEKQSAPVLAPPSDPKVLMTVPISIEVGGELSPLVALNTQEGKRFLDRLINLRQMLYTQMGVIFPALRLDSTLLPFSDGQNFRVWLAEMPICSGRIRTDQVLVSASSEQLSQYGIEGESTLNPADRKPASWIKHSDSERITALGIQSWLPHQVLLLHIAGFLRFYAKEFISLFEVQQMLNQLRKMNPTIVDEVVPKIISLQGLTEVLKELLAEQVSIKDLRAILEAIAGAPLEDRGDPIFLCEYVRVALRRRICFQLSDANPFLFAYELAPELEEFIRRCIRQGPNGPLLAMDFEGTQAVIEAVRSAVTSILPKMQSPVIFTEAGLRRPLRKLVADTLPEVRILSYGELASEIRVEPLGTIGLASLPQPEEAALVLS